MTLNARGDIYTDPTTSSFKGACANGSAFTIVTSEPRFRRYSILPGSLTATASSASLTGSTPTDLVFISGATAVCSYQGSTRVDFVDTGSTGSSLIISGIATNVTAANRAAPQQIAGNTTLGLAVETSGTSGRLTFITLTCAAAVNPAFLSGKTANCIISRPDTGTFIVGTNDGKIHEFNSSTTLLTTVHTPSAPSFGSPTIGIQALAYYNNYLLAATDSGLLFTYNWSTKALISTTVNMVGAAGFSTLSNSVSGIVLMSNNTPFTQNYKGIMELYIDNPTTPNIDSTNFLEANVGVNVLGIEPSGLYAWAFSTSSSFIPGRIFFITSPAKVGVQTESMNPLGNDVGYRIIRIRDANDIGNAVVEVDQQFGPGATNITVTNSRNYIEVCLFGNIVNGNPPYTGWGIREMQS